MRGMLEQAHALKWGAPPAARQPQPEGARAPGASGNPPVPSAVTTGQPESHAAVNPGLPRAAESSASDMQPRDQTGQVPDEAGLFPTHAAVHGEGPADQPPASVLERIYEDAVVDADTVGPDALPSAPRLGSGDAPIQSPLIEPMHVLGLIKEGYQVDPHYAAGAAEKRAELGIKSAGSLFVKGVAICVPDTSELHRSITSELHCSPYCGHVGMNKTYALVQRYFYWPGMKQFISDYVRGFVICQRNNAAPGKTAG